MDVWDKTVKPEENSYFNKDKPIIRERKNKSTDFIHIDLFSGCGGFSCGFEQAGFITEVALDIHCPSIETIDLNHKYTSTILGDIRKVSPSTIRELISDQKSNIVMTAGVPCQGFSRSNRKRNDNDERNFYFKEFIKFAKIIKPKVVVIENVSGISVAKQGYFFSSISKELEKLGFKVSTSLLNAADYGVPQTRKRFFFIGIRSEYNWLFPYGTHNLDNYITVEDSIIGDLPKLSNNEFKELYKSKPTSEYQKLIRGSNNKLTNHKAPNHPKKTIETIKNTLPGQPMYSNFKQRVRLNPALPSPTQICGGIRPQFQFGHPIQARGLSIRERARIQSFPDNYHFIGGLVQGRVQTGNAVPVLLSKAIATQIKKMLLGKKLKGFNGQSSQNKLI